MIRFATTTRRAVLATGCALAGAALVPALAEVPTPRIRPKGIDASRLKPGEFVWSPELAPEGPVVVIVSLPDQLVHVYRNGVEIGISTCSTGKPGHATPTGVFVILQKDRNHRSSTYNDAPMPNMERLTWDGVALHAGNLPGYPASHGCVRLPLAFSRLLFETTHLGVPVIVADARSAPAEVTHPGILLPAAAEAEAMAAVAAAARKPPHPVDATTDTHVVVSLVVSGADRTLDILENGELAFTSPVTVRDPDVPLGNHVFKLLDADADGTSLTWLAHRIAGEPAGPDAVLARIAVDDWIGAVGFLSNLAPGSTLVVTDLSAGPDTRSGIDFVILADDGAAA